ncbi:MAG: hypothetical protein KAH20_01180 [Methylococcales bacterium]|nr:hypothetical protein [Methylococcales bacterium]
MIFDNLTTYPDMASTYKENGITASGPIGSYGRPESIHLEDFGTPFNMGAHFSMEPILRH